MFVAKGLKAAAAVSAAVALGMVGASSAAAQGAPESFADLAERLSPAVVNIATAQNINRGETFEGEGPFPDGSPFERFNEFFDRGGPAARRATSLGSGFVIDADGVIVTNNHVIEGADEITVNFSDGRSFTAEIVGRDPETDLAVLRVDTDEELPFASWGDSDTSRVGDWVVAIGNPFGLGQTVTAGIISARERDINATRYDEFIQTDASINRGNSGGPLFDMDGDVIGVNTAIISPSGGSIGIGFAVPANLARRYVEQLIEYGETFRGWLGVRIEPVTDDQAAFYGLDRPYGAVVTGITEESPADKGGLEVGDVILRYSGEDVANPRELSKFVADTEVGSTVRMEVLRENQRRNLRITIERLETSPLGSLNTQDENAPEVRPSSAKAALGLTLERLTQENRRRYRIANDVEGVVVVDVDPTSDAARKILPGDVIAQIGYEDVGTPDEAISEIEKVVNDSGKPVLLQIIRDGDPTFRAVKPN